MRKQEFLCLILLVFVCQGTEILDEKKKDSRPSLVNVMGKGRVRVPPDQVEITVGITQRAKTVEQVQDDVDSTSANIIAYLKEIGVEDRDMKTTMVCLNPSYIYTGYQYSTTEVDFYSATKSVTFIYRDVSQFESVLTGLYGIGVNTVNSISFKVEDVQEQRKEAKRRAVGQARKIAETLTEGLDHVTVGGVYSVNDQTYDNEYFPVVYAPVVGCDTTLSGGEVEITAIVNIAFYLVNGKF